MGRGLYALAVARFRRNVGRNAGCRSAFFWPRKGARLLIIHEPLEVRRRDTRPVEQDPLPEGWVESFAEFLLTKALEGACVIEAERLRGDTAPTLWRHRARNTREPVNVLAQTPPRIFRTLLAYFGGKYLERQLYGGCVRRVLRQGRTTTVVIVHTGNEGVAGFWIRIGSGSPSVD
jgi:hypothetical protein